MSEPKDPSEELTTTEEVSNTPEPEPDKPKTSSALQALEAHVQRSKMQRKASIRTGISIGVIVLLVAAAWKVVPTITNSDPGEFDSANYIIALKDDGTDRRTVILDMDGGETPSPDFVKGSTEQSPVWSGDGQRIYFISDRDNHEPHVFRWNPKPSKLLGLFTRPQIERRTIDSRAKSQLSFTVPGEISKSALLVSGGTVLEFDPSDGKTRQVLPPPKLQGTAGATEDGSRSSQFDAGYVPGATGFLTARWLPKKGFIAATLRTEEGGEVMITQNVIEPGQPPQVFPLAGDHIDYDVDPVSGSVVVAIQNAKWVSREVIPKEFIKNGEAKMPFKHGIMVMAASGAMTPLTPPTLDDKVCWSKPRVAPAGLEKAGFLVISGTYNPQTKTQTAQALLWVNPSAGNAGGTKGMAAGNVTGGDWHPSGNKIIFTMFVAKNNRKSICTMNLDGTDPKVLTRADADYSNATFSPMSQ